MSKCGYIFFIRKEKNFSPIKFQAIKLFKDKHVKQDFILKKKYNYYAGWEFEEFIKNNKKNNIKISFYLKKEEILKNKWKNKVILLNINTNKKEIYYVNNILYQKIKNNILYIRPIDSWSWNKRAGLYCIKELDIDIDGILTEKTHRTHLIHLFFEDSIDILKQLKIKENFNTHLEALRKKFDSCFLTTFKYSKCEYTRKILWLKQVKQILSILDI